MSQPPNRPNRTPAQHKSITFVFLAMSITPLKDEITEPTYHDGELVLGDNFVDGGFKHSLNVVKQLFDLLGDEILLSENFWISVFDSIPLSKKRNLQFPFVRAIRINEIYKNNHIDTSAIEEIISKYFKFAENPTPA